MQEFLRKGRKKRAQKRAKTEKKRARVIDRRGFLLYNSDNHYKKMGARLVRFAYAGEEFKEDGPLEIAIIADDKKKELMTQF